MRLTILGNNGPYPGPGGACSGYLLSEGETHVMLDCGPGTLANLQRHIPIGALAAVVFSHIHYDHMSDAPSIGVAMAAHGLPVPPMYAPETPEHIRAHIPGARFAREFAVGEMAFSLTPARHPVEAYSIAVACKGRKFVYTGDTNWHDGLADVCRGADFLLADAAFFHERWAENKPHLSARLCGQLAAEAGAKRLALTHLFPGNRHERAEAEAREAFEGAVAAEIGAVFEIE